jgi:hypothetical protein
LQTYTRLEAHRPAVKEQMVSVARGPTTGSITIPALAHRGRFQRALLRVWGSPRGICHAKDLERLGFFPSLFPFRVDDQQGLLLALLKTAPRRRPSSTPFISHFFHDLSSGIITAADRFQVQSKNYADGLV